MVFLMSLFGMADPGCPTNCIGESAEAAEVIGGIDGSGGGAAFGIGAPAGRGAGAGAEAGTEGGSGRERGRMCFNLLFL